MRPSYATIVTMLLVLQVVHHRASGQNFGQSCTNPRGQAGDCRNIKNCEPLLEVIRIFGNSQRDFLTRSLCGPTHGGDPIVCCPHVDNNGNRNTNNNNNNYNNNNNNNNVNSNSLVPSRTRTAYGPLESPECGVPATEYTRVVGGVPAKLGAWPWATALGYHSKQNPGTTRWLCGGVLISARHVLTAAHCVYQRDDLFQVRVGDLDLASDNDGATPVDVPIESRHLHPQYSPSIYTNDIAVLRLAYDLQFTRLIKPVCLPVTEVARKKNLANAFPFLVGWGSVYFNGPSAAHLQQTQVPIVPEPRCKDAFKDFPTATIDGRVLCAGYAQGGKDACQGDSGGPLVVPINGTWYSIGVVSYGFRCALPGYPGVYTKTMSFLDFILPLLN